MAVAEIETAPSARTIAVLTVSALAVALLILFGGILPAEYARDPVGFGRLLGTNKLWAPAETVAASSAKATPDSRSYPTAFRSDVVEVPLAAGGDPSRNDEVEYKVRLPKGGSLVYSWEVPGVAKPEEFYTEFHGETLGTGSAMTVAYYRKDTGTRDNGVLTAPFDGRHGWYFQNQSEKPVKVRLRLAGFYELIPPGEPGNEGEVVAKPIG